MKYLWTALVFIGLIGPIVNSNLLDSIYGDREISKEQRIYDSATDSRSSRDIIQYLKYKGASIEIKLLMYIWGTYIAAFGCIMLLLSRIKQLNDRVLLLETSIENTAKTETEAKP